jgi:hypothetical protein
VGDTKSREELLRVAAEVIAGERDRASLDEHCITIGPPIVGDEAKERFLAELEAEADDDEEDVAASIADALWATMVEQGVKERTRGRFEAIFFAKDQHAATSLVSDLDGDDGWKAEIAKANESDGRLRIVVVTRPLVRGHSVLVVLAGLMVDAARTHGCELQGLQPAPSRPWWRFW